MNKLNATDGRYLLHAAKEALRLRAVHAVRVRGMKQVEVIRTMEVSKTALYMATRSASQYNPMIREMYQRLLAAGKPKKVAQCACARKLLIKLNSLVGEQTGQTNLNPKMLSRESPTAHEAGP